MQDWPLTIAAIMRHACGVNGDRVVITATGQGGYRTTTYAELGQQAARLAHGLRGLGVTGDQRVGTFMWNNAEHLEAYLAVPSMGAVLPTINIRLFPEQVTYVVNHAEDTVVIVDASLLTPFAALLPTIETVTHVLVAGPGSESVDLGPLESSGKQVVRYEEALAVEPDSFAWPEIDERDAAAIRRGEMIGRHLVAVPR